MTLAQARTALRGTDEIEITVTERKSGREISNPVWFVQEGHRLNLLPVRGSDSEWYQNATKKPDISLQTAGTGWTAKATAITDPSRVNEVVERFRTKYGADQVRRHYSKFDVAVEVPPFDGGL